MTEREQPVGRLELARYYQVDVRTIHNWVAAGMPTRRRSGASVYLLSEVIPWRRAQDKAEARGGGTAADENAERRRKLSAEADLAELRVQEQTGRLVPASEVERTWERTLGVVRSRITAIRGRWAPKVLGLGTMQAATAVLDALVEDVLAALVEGADEIEAGTDEEAA